MPDVESDLSIISLWITRRTGIKERQLSRAPESRSDRRPQLADLRESGALEQDADVVMFIYRDEQYDPTPENENLAEIILGKQRNGPTGTVKMAFLKQYTRFANLSPVQA